MVLSREGGALPKLLPLFKLGLGGRFGSGRQWWSWITLDDQVEAIVWLLTRPVWGPVNLTGPEPVTNAELHQGPGPGAAPSGRPARSRTSGPACWSVPSWPRPCCSPAPGCHPDALLASGYRFQHPELPDALRSVLDRT